MSTRRETGSHRYAAFRRDEIIVALPHLDQVLLVLDLAGVQPDEVEQSSGLDLARLSVPDAEAAADDVLTWVTGQGVDAPARRDTDRDIDRLLAGLRAFFAARHAGWTPTMGKNRLVGAVNGGGGAISHGGGGTPTRQSGVLPPRGSGPGKDVRVGVLDTALAPQPWLSGGWVAGYSDRLPQTDTYPEGAGHATFVTGLILSQAPGATVVARKVLTQDKHGEYTADCWTVANAIVEIGRTGIDVLNLSLVCYTEDGQPPLLLSTAISRLDREVVVVAAAGNHGDLDRRGSASAGSTQTPAGSLPAAPVSPKPVEDDDLVQISKPTFPAALDGVIAVGAANGLGEPARFTPLNKYWIDLLAPGVDVPGTYLAGKVRLDDPNNPTEDFDGLACWSGSSFAAALISGAVAAGVQPGRVTARESLENIQRAVSTGRRITDPDTYVPPFVPLELTRPLAEQVTSGANRAGT
jgi:hypothetical protein